MLHWTVPSAQKHSYMPRPSAQTPPFWHGFEWHSSRSTSQKAPPNPAKQVFFKKKKKRNFSSHWNPRLSSPQRHRAGAGSWRLIRNQRLADWLRETSCVSDQRRCTWRLVHPSTNGHVQPHGPLMRLLTEASASAWLHLTLIKQKAYKKKKKKTPWGCFFHTKECEKWMEIGAQVRQSSMWWKQVLNHCMSQTTWKCGKVPLVVDELLEELRLEQAEF